MPEISRRNFFRVQLNKSNIIRPPWAIDDEKFTDLCSRCDECIAVCPEKIISRGDGGFPEVKFINSGCEFCEDCLNSCKTKALEKKFDDSIPWKHQIKINDKCLPKQSVICRTCFEACEEEVISFTLEAGKVPQPKLNLENCNGCGFCIAMCPVDAIIINEFNE